MTLNLYHNLICYTTHLNCVLSKIYICSESIWIEDIPWSGRRNLLQSNTPGTLGERFTTYFRPDRNVWRCSWCWCWRNCFYGVLFIVQIIYFEAHKEAIEWPHYTRWFTIHKGIRLYVHKVHFTANKFARLVWILPWRWRGAYLQVEVYVRVFFVFVIVLYVGRIYLCLRNVYSVNLKQWFSNRS